MSQMAEGFSNAIRTDVSFGVNFIIYTRNLELFLLFCFKQCVLDLSGLLGLNPVIIFFPFTAMQLLLGDVSLLFVC